MGFLFGGDTGQTQDSITDARRRMAVAMMQQGQQSTPIQSPWQGVARLSEALMGGLAFRQQAQQEREANSQVMSAITGQPYSPPPQQPGFLSSLFGSNKVPASDAQGQVAAASPGAQSSVTPGGNPDVSSYIQQAAASRGIDPKIALKVAGHEGLNVFDPSKPDNGGDERSSFGPFQLHYAGLSKSMPHSGLGDEFTKATGLDARDPSTWQKQVDFSLDWAKNHGWSPWMGAKAEGITGMMGIGNAPPSAVASVPQQARGQVASLDPSSGMGAPQQPYRDPMVTTAYQQPAPVSPAAQAIQQQLTPEQVASGNAMASIPTTGQQVGGPNALPPGPRPDPNAAAAIPVGQNGQMVIPAGPLGPEQAYQPDPTQTASIGPQGAPPMAAAVNIPNQPISSPMPADRSGVGMGGAAPGPGAFPTAPGDGPARLAAALQGTPQQPQGNPGTQQLAQAMQSAPQGQGGSVSPLAGNPRAQALMQAMMNPYASPQAREMAGSMLQMQMQPHTQILTNPNTGTSYLVNTLTGEKTLIDQGQTADSELEKDASGMPIGTFNKRTAQYSPLANTPQSTTGLPAGIKPTDDYYNWQISKNGGDPRSFADYQADMRKAGAQSVTIAGETEESKALGTARAANIVDYMKAGPEARDKLQALNIISDAFNAGNGNISTGPGAEMILQGKQALQNLGVNMDGVAPTETVKKMGAYLAAAAAKSLAARPTQFDFKTFLQNNPGLDISVPGNKMLVNIMQQQSQHEMDLSRLAQSYKGSSADWNDVVSQYDKDHPIISPFTGKPLSPTEKMFPNDQKQGSDNGGRSAPAVGTVEGGYTFKGGNPADPASWEKAL